MAPFTEFHAKMADVTNEEHENMGSLLQSDDFNAEVVARFLRDNGIDASVDESTSGIRYTAVDATRASHGASPASVCARQSAARSRSLTGAPRQSDDPENLATTSSKAVQRTAETPR